MHDAARLPSISELLASHSVSHWLKAALSSAVDRDPVDAARDSELLAAVLVARASDLIHRKTNA
jgi:hypothetical protein